MSEIDCVRCDNGEHDYNDAIEVEGKYFCPKTYRRLMFDDETDEMTEDELDVAYSEKLEMVTAPVYRIVKEVKSE